MTPLKLVSLDDVVVFPGMPVTLPADGDDDARVLLIPRRGSGYAKVGVVAEVSERVVSGGRGLASFMALHRGVPGAAHTGPDGVLRVEVDERPDTTPPASLTRTPCMPSGGVAMISSSRAETDLYASSSRSFASSSPLASRRRFPSR